MLLRSLSIVSSLLFAFPKVNQDGLTPLLLWDYYYTQINPINMKGPSHLLLILLMTLALQAWSQSVAWTHIPQVRSGQITITTEIISSAASPVVMNQTFAVALTGSNSTYYYGFSLISYESWMTDSFAFNTSLAALTSTFIKVSFAILDVTYFTKARIHYITGRQPATPYFSMQVCYGCFLTANLLVSNAVRTQTVSNQTTTITDPNAIVKSMIGGLELTNSIGTDNSVIVNTTNNGGILSHKITVGTNNFLRFICLTTVIVDPNVLSNTYRAIIEWKTLYLVSNSTMNEVQYQESYDGTSRMFFGFSSFNHSMADTRYLNVQTANIALVSELFASSMLNSMSFEMFFFAYRTCSAGLFYNPITYTCALTCFANQIQTPNLTLCRPCYYPCSTCNSNNSATCMTCNSTKNRASIANSTCPCANNYVDVGVETCQLCSKYLSGCITCSSTTNCTSCEAAYVINNMTYKCNCRTGFYNASSYCLPYPGCQVAFYMTSGTKCSDCDTNNNFTLTSNGSCECLQGMYLNTTTNASCYDNCGDNVTAFGYCDDGNWTSGDGCSDNCEIESGWHCTYNTTTGGKSACVVKYNLVLTYLYSKKLTQLNQAEIVFSLTPPQYGLPTNIFKNSITTSLPAISASFLYDPVTSVVTMLVAYSQSIQGTTQTLLINFSGLSIYAEPFQLSFTPTGINAQLVVEAYAAQSTIIKYVATGVSFLAVVITIFSAVVGLKLIGIELILPVQLIYFALSTFETMSSYTSSLNHLQYANGYNQLAAYDYARTYMQNQSLINMGYQTEYLLSCNVMIGIFLLILNFLLVHHFKLKYKEHKLETFLESPEYKRMAEEDSQDGEKESSESQERETDQEEEKMKLKKEVKGKNRELQQQEYKMRSGNHRSLKLFTFQVDRVYFVFFVLLINQTMFSFIIMTLNLPISEFVFSEYFDVMACNLFYFLFIGNLAFISYDQDSNKMIAFTCIKDRYSMVYLALDFLIIVVLAMTFTQSFSTYLVTVLSVLFVVLIIKERPYNNVFFTLENIFALYNQLMLVASLIIICYLKADNGKSELAEMVGSFVILGLIAIAEILSMIRIGIKVNLKKAFDELKNHDIEMDKSKKKKNKKVIEKKLDLLDQDNEKVEILPPDSIRNGLFTPKDRIMDWESRNTEEYQSWKKQEIKRQVAVDNHEQDVLSDAKVDQKINELELIKRRLRNNFNMKKEQLKKESQLSTKPSY